MNSINGPSVDGGGSHISYAAHSMGTALQRSTSPRRDTARIVFLIGSWKLVKAAALIAVGIGAHDLRHGDVTERITQWAHALHADPDNRYIHSLIEQVVAMPPARLEQFSVGTFFYAALFLAEGMGLLRDKPWAELLTVVTTALLLPLELYALSQKLTSVRIAILVLNIAIVWYLIARLRSRTQRARQEP